MKSSFCPLQRLSQSAVAALFALSSVTSFAADVLIGANQFDCVISPNETVNLGTVAAGVLASVSVGRGDAVTSGQVLARIESSVEEAAVELARVRAASTSTVDAARTRLAFEKAKLARNEKLAKEKIISQEELEAIEKEVELAVIALRQAQVDDQLDKLELQRAESLLGLREIKSPFDGVVTEKLLAAGDFVDGETVLIVAQMNPLKVEARIPASLYAGVDVGMPAEIQLKEAVGGIYAARVSVKDSVLDPQNSTFRVRLDLPNPGLRLPAGVRCGVKFLPN